MGYNTQNVSGSFRVKYCKCLAGNECGGIRRALKSNRISIIVSFSFLDHQLDYVFICREQERHNILANNAPMAIPFHYEGALLKGQSFLKQDRLWAVRRDACSYRLMVL